MHEIHVFTNSPDMCWQDGSLNMAGLIKMAIDRLTFGYTAYFFDGVK
jgi:hypothetical protein